MDIKKVKQVAWVGDQYMVGEIRGVVLNFHGLGFNHDKSWVGTDEIELAKNGWLVVFPYYGPWSWMNRQARAFVDELVDAIYTNYSLCDNIPLVAMGGSMGGFSALLYTRYAKRPIAACLALCPVCDLKYHFGERPDLPKTIYNAFYGYKEDMEEVFIEHSPLMQVSNMPNIPYLIIHGAKDDQVNKDMHSTKMVKEMKAHNLNVEYLEVAEMAHIEPTPMYVLKRIIDFVNTVK